MDNYAGWPVVQVHECSRVSLTCRSAREALRLHLHSVADQRKSGGGMFLRRSSPYLVVLMPQVGCHRWYFRGFGCCARCAAVRQGPRSRPGLLPARAIPALAVNGARPPRRSFVSLLVLPGSAVRAAAAALPALPYRLGTCQSGDITSPERLAGVTSPPFRCSQIRLGSQQYAPSGRRGDITV